MVSKKSVFGEYARVFQAFASASRIDLLELLFQGERGVDQLAEESGMSVANVSQHLQVLRRARLIESRKDGLRVLYRLSSDSVYTVWEQFRRFGESQVMEIREALKGFESARADLEAVDSEELQRRLETGECVVVDVRPTPEYVSGHSAGALAVPVPELVKRLETLPKDKTIVAYCRGPYCLQSDEAVRILKDAGFKALRLEVGLPEWKAMNLPVETEVNA